MFHKHSGGQRYFCRVEAANIAWLTNKKTKYKKEIYKKKQRKPN